MGILKKDMSDRSKNMLTRLGAIRYLSPWVFLALFMISASVSVLALRHNNQQMVKLRSAVYEADKSGGDVNAALNNLRWYIYGRMNTNLSSGGNAIKPPIQLKYTYERLQSTAQVAATNAGLYTEAENYCQDRIPASVSVSGRGRISCVQDYILNHGGKAPAAIPVGLYQFDFLSPTWSPDLAGWSLLVSVGLFLAFLVSFASDKLVSSRLKSI